VYGYYNQQDSQEAFANLLDIMENEIEKMKLGDYRLDFQGYLVYQLHCFNCKKTELLFQDNMTLMLDIERNSDEYPKLMKKVHELKTGQTLHGKSKNFIEFDKESIKEHKNVQRSGFLKNKMRIYEDISRHTASDNMNKKETRLENMLTNFFDYSFFSKQEHEYQCEDCKKKSTFAFKKYYIFRPPEVLVLCVKKFAKSKYSLFGRWTKSSVNVTYPEILDLSDHMVNINLNETNKRGIFRLVGVVNHSGGLGGGHYTSYIRKNEKWYYISDSYYKESSLKSALNADAYLVFYEKI
jgi:ubiquitin C-terminal hydrolase